MMLQGDARHLPLDDNTVDLIVTSVPYLRQRVYGDDPNELGQEATVAAYVQHLADIFDEARRVLKPTGWAALNIGDKANNSGGAGGDWKRTPSRIKGRGAKVGPFRDRNYPDGSFCDVPGAVLAELLRRRWRLRMPIVWDKGAQSAEDLRHIRRPRWSHEMIYLLAPTAERGKWYPSALTETGSVWHFPPGGTGNPHLAPFPDELARRCILPTTLPGDLVLDPFAGSGTVPRVAEALGRRGIGIELYHDPARDETSPAAANEVPKLAADIAVAEAT